MALCGDL